jgi:hypothetical protein
MCQLPISPGDPQYVFLQEVKEGDLRKQMAVSNDSATGGGARDLRMPARFWQSLSRFFPNEISERERTGEIYSISGSIPRPVNISFWRPTGARPNEIRIGKIHLIESWMIDAAYYSNELAEGYILFYLLTIDSNHRVWARIMSSRHGHLNRPDFACFLRELIDAKSDTSKVVRAVFSFSGGNHYT